MRKFCKNTECWVRICPKCAVESHKGHKVIEFSSLTSETKAMKEKLIRAKRNDIGTLKAIIDGLNNMNLQLNSSQQKYKEEGKLMEANILAKIQNALEESEIHYKGIQGRVLELKESMDEMHKIQSAELARITDLTNAILSKGSDEDFKIFFEMCEKGMESNFEITRQKSEMESMKITVKEFTVNNTFKSLFGNNKSFYEVFSTPSPGK